MRNIKKVFVLILCICCFTMITIAAQKNKKIEYNDFNKNPLPEIANLEEDFIKIYGVKSSGVVVCFEDKSKFFEWNLHKTRVSSAHEKDPSPPRQNRRPCLTEGYGRNGCLKETHSRR